MKSQSRKSLCRSIVIVILFVAAASQGLFGLESDIGLRAYDGTEIIKVAVDANHTIYSLKIHKEGITYGVMLVDPAHPDASMYRISTGSGIKALKKFDETPPTLTLVTISSTNSSSSFAKVGDDVTISFTASESLLASPTVTIDGNTVGSIANPSGNNYTATRTMQNGDTDGQIAFTINFVDGAANPGVQVTSITTGGNIIFDEIPPTLTSVTITSSNADPTIAREGDIVTISFTSGETLAAIPEVTIEGNAADLVQNPSGNNYTAIRTMQTEDEAGQVTFTISNFTDRAGNAGTPVSSITSGTNTTFMPSFVMVSPVSASADLPVESSFDHPNCTPDKMIDQSGLVTPFIDGVTNYSAYISQDPKNVSGIYDFCYISENDYFGNGVVLDFDLGSSYEVAHVVIWNGSIHRGNEDIGIKDAVIYFSENADFSASTTYNTVVDVVADASIPHSPFIIDLASSVSARYVRIFASTNHGNLGHYSVSEVVLGVVND